MAGRGDSRRISDPGAGYEFRAVTDPSRLYRAAEPFGINENRSEGIDDTRDGRPRKTGGPALSFINEFFRNTAVPIVGVSASEGGTRIDEWLPGTGRHQDMISRLEAAKAYLAGNGWAVRHTLVLFCQGESDGDAGTDPAVYRERLLSFWASLKAHGAEKLLIILIGKCSIEGKHDLYDGIRCAQSALASEDIIIASSLFETFLSKGLMKDAFHYRQEGYDEAGRDAAINTCKALYP